MGVFNTTSLVDTTIQLRTQLMTKVFIAKQDFPEVLNNSHFRILIYLIKNGPVALGAIGKDLGIKKTNISALINDLVKLSLIVLLPAAHDKRIKRANLTAQGLSTTLKIERQMQENIKERLDKIPAVQRQEYELHAKALIQILSSL